MTARVREPPIRAACKRTKPAERVAVARLDGLFGVRGELKCRPSSAGEALIEVGRRFWIDAGGERGVTISAVRRHHGRFVIALEGIEDASSALPFVGAQLFAERDALVLESGEYLDEDLIGLRLVDERGDVLGTVAGVQHYPASDCLVVQPHGALVPLVAAFILRIDVPARTIEVRLPPGLLDPAQAEEA